MNSINLTLGLPFAQFHAEAYGFMLFVLPALVFLSAKIWLISRDGAKAERTTQWSLPPGTESDAMRVVFNYSRRSVVFIQEALSDVTEPSATGTTNHDQRS